MSHEHTPTEAEVRIAYANTRRGDGVSRVEALAEAQRTFAKVRAEERAKRPDRDQMRQLVHQALDPFHVYGAEFSIGDTDEVADAVLSLERADDAMRSASEDDRYPDMPVSFGPLEHCIRHIGGTHGDYVGEVMHRPRTEWTSCDCEDRDS